MLDWIADWFLKVFTFLPPIVFEDQTIHFTIFRAMLGLIVVSFVLFLIAILRK